MSLPLINQNLQQLVLQNICNSHHAQYCCAQGINTFHNTCKNIWVSDSFWMHSTSFSFLPHLFLFLLVKGSISIYYKSCKFSRLLRCTPAKYERPKHAFISVLSICLAPLSYENQLEIELMYLFVYNKMRSKILFTIHKLQVSSSVLAFFSFGQTNRS